MSAMKQIGLVNTYEKYNKRNSVFDPASYVLGENLEYPSVLLKKTLNKMGMDLNTLDMRPLEEFISVIFIDMPSAKSLPEGVTLDSLRRMGKKLYLVICESKLTIPGNWDRNNHAYFEKIFTWNDPLADEKKYIKICLPNKVPGDFNIDTEIKDGFCALIAGNHANKDPRELYSERRKAIRWFEKNHPEEFDLYGRGWGSELFSAAIGQRFHQAALPHPANEGKVRSGSLQELPRRGRVEEPDAVKI